MRNVRNINNFVFLVMCITSIFIVPPFAGIAQVPYWLYDMNAREQELLELRRANGETAYELTRQESFPTVYSDLSFKERVENDKIGYEPFKDSRAFHEISIQIDKKPVRAKPVQQEVIPAADVCKVPVGVTTLDENGDRIYSFFNTDEVEATLTPLVNKKYTWGAVFPYGIILGETLDGKVKGENKQCDCRITKYISNDKEYSGFNKVTLKTSLRYSSEDAANRVKPGQPDLYADYFSFCSGQCLFELVTDAESRADFFGDVFPHTDSASCPKEIYADLSADRRIYFNYNNNGTEVELIDDRFLDKYTGTRCSKAHNERAFNQRIRGETVGDEHRCYMGDERKGHWKAIFEYGVWRGKAFCADNGQCSCAFISLGVFKVQPRNTMLPERISNDLLVTYVNNEEVESRKEDLVKFKNKNACLKKCANQCAFAVGQAGEKNIEFRQSLLPIGTKLKVEAYH